MTRRGAWEMPIVVAIGVLLGVLTLGYTWAVTAENGWLSATTSPATLAFAETPQGTTWTASFERGIAAGKQVWLQKQTIRTTMTQTVDQQTVPVQDAWDTPTWVTIAMQDADDQGIATFTITKPLGVPHEYRAVVNAGKAQVVTKPVTFAPAHPGAGHGLATIHLDTNEGSAISSTHVFWEGRLSIVAGDGCEALEPAQVKISGRGSTSWEFEKKSYNVTLGEAANLCGMGRAAKWALVANHLDRSLLRNSVALHVASQLTGMAFTPRSVPVDLVVQGEYRGSYLLVERVEFGKERIDTPEIPDAAAGQGDPNVGPLITGGYLLEWDGRADRPTIRLAERGTMRIVEPSEDTRGPKLSAQQKAYITDYVNRADAALFGPRFTDPTIGWRAFIDEKSLVDYFIVQEFTKNQDANLNASVYMWKERDRPEGPGKLHFGPVWDFDASMGNMADDGNQELTTGWWIRDTNPDITAKQVDQTWFNRVGRDPAFRAAVAERWKQVAPIFAQIPAYVDAEAARIEASANANFAEYQVTERLAERQVIKGSWKAEVAALKDWSVARTRWMSSQLK